MKTKTKALFALFLLASFIFVSCGPQKKGKRMSNSGPRKKIRTEMGGM